MDSKNLLVDHISFYKQNRYFKDNEIIYAFQIELLNINYKRKSADGTLTLFGAGKLCEEYFETLYARIRLQQYNNIDKLDDDEKKQVTPEQIIMNPKLREIKHKIEVEECYTAFIAQYSDSNSGLYYTKSWNVFFSFLIQYGSYIIKFYYFPVYYFHTITEKEETLSGTDKRNLQYLAVIHILFFIFNLQVFDNVEVTYYYYMDTEFTAGLISFYILPGIIFIISQFIYPVIATLSKAIGLNKVLNKKNDPLVSNKLYLNYQYLLISIFSIFIFYYPSLDYSKLSSYSIIYAFVILIFFTYREYTGYKLLKKNLNRTVELYNKYYEKDFNKTYNGNVIFP